MNWLAFIAYSISTTIMWAAVFVIYCRTADTAKTTERIDKKLDALLKKW